MDIEELIERGETQSVEFKESLRLKDEIGETVSAFSNLDGGTVIIGVSNKNHAYKRVGKTNQMISSSELRKLAKESGERIYWDERVCEDASLDEIEEKKVKFYLEKRREVRGVKKPEKMDLKTLLLNIKAGKEVNGEIKLTNAGILFFRRNLGDDRGSRRFYKEEYKAFRVQN